MAMRAGSLSHPPSSGLGPGGHMPQGRPVSPPKSLQRNIPPSNFPTESSRRVMRRSHSQIGPTRPNAKGQGEATSHGGSGVGNPGPGDPRRTSARDPRYQGTGRRNLVDRSVHSTLMAGFGLGEET